MCIKKTIIVFIALDLSERPIYIVDELTLFLKINLVNKLKCKTTLLYECRDFNIKKSL